MPFRREHSVILAHELREGDKALLLGDDGERHSRTVSSVERDGRGFNVEYEDGGSDYFGENDRVYIEPR